MPLKIIKWRCHYAGGRTTKDRATQLMDTEMARIKLSLYYHEKSLFLDYQNTKKRFSEMSSSNIQRDNPTLTHTQYIPTLFLPFPGFYILEPHVFPIAASSINCSNFIILHAVITGSPPDLRNGKWVGMSRNGFGLVGMYLSRKFSFPSNHL